MSFICPTNIHTYELGYKTTKKIRKFRKKLVKKLIKHKARGEDYFQILHFLEGYLLNDVIIVNVQNKEDEDEVHKVLHTIGFMQRDGMGNNYIRPPKK